MGPVLPYEAFKSMCIPFLLQHARFVSILLIVATLAAGSERSPAGESPQGASNDGLTKDMPRPEAFRIMEDLIYLQPGRTEKLDLYLPARAPGDPPVPGVIWAHGNGSDKGSSHIREECETFAAAGYACASINWTLDTPFRVLPILDCKNAVRFLRVHAAEYHVDPQRIAIGGGSGGGYLASMVGFTIGEAGFEPPEPYPGISSAVCAIIDFYGGYDAMRWPLIQGQMKVLPLNLAGVRPALKQIALFQPVNHLTPTAPPVLIVQGKDDPLIEYHQALEMDDDLAAKGVPHELILMDHVGHAFTFTTWENQPLPRDLRPALLAFLRKYLGPVNRSDHTDGHAQ